MTTLIHRLRSRRPYCSDGLPELLEEAAQEIERLQDLCETYLQAAEYLAGPSSADWRDDT